MSTIDDEMIRDLDAVQGHLTGHFKLRSGRCSDEFFQFAMLGRRPLRLRRYGQLLADQLRRHRIQTLVGVAKGGIAVVQEVGARLEEFSPPETPPIDVVYAEKARYDEKKGIWLADESSDIFRLLRGFDRFVPERRVGIVEDAVTTGGSGGRLATHIRELGGEVVVFGTLLLRGEIRAEQLTGVPREAVCTVSAKDWDPSECPMHKQDLPFTPIPGKN